MDLNGKGYMVAHIVLFITYYFHQADKIHISYFKRTTKKMSYKRSTFWTSFKMYFHEPQITLQLSTHYT